MPSKEFSLSAMIAIVATFISMFLGGWDAALKVLVFCMITDYITGVLGALKTHTLNSEDMFWGGIRKAIILVVIALAVKLDLLVSNPTPLFRTIAIYFYVSREGLSIVENIGILGVPLPGVITKVLVQLQEKGEVKQDGKSN